MGADQTIKDSTQGGWVEHMPEGLRPYLRLSRYDRPIGFWLLALPGWIGLAFAALTEGFVRADIKWAVLIGIGAVAMRGAGCTYNDIVDRDLDKLVERTALRPLAAGTISVKSAWVWLVFQCLAGLAVLTFFPRLSQIIALSSLALVAAYPFMKRITYWPQAWLGLTFNWAVLVAYTAKTGHVAPPLFLLYAGLVFWTIGYDTIYACQDVEDDALIGVKSTARLFGDKTKPSVAILYSVSVVCIFVAARFESLLDHSLVTSWPYFPLAQDPDRVVPTIFGFVTFFYAGHLLWQVWWFKLGDSHSCLRVFKSNQGAALFLVLGLVLAEMFLYVR